MKIVIPDDVKPVIKDIFDYASNISLSYAKKIINKIYETIYSLQSSPYSGRYVPELLSRHYRERICENYRIIYLVSEIHKTVYIRYIISSRENSNLFFEVHKKELYNLLNQFLNENF